jgi:hypothetical protein
MGEPLQEASFIIERCKLLDEVMTSLDLRIGHLNPDTEREEIKRLTAERDATRLAFADLVRQRHRMTLRRVPA